MFDKNDVMVMAAQYNLGRSDGETKAKNRDRGNGQAFDDFYQDGYDDAVSGKRSQLVNDRAEHTGANDDDEGFAKRQVLYAFRSAVESVQNGSPAAIMNAINLAAERLMRQGSAFFRESLACPRARGGEPQSVDDYLRQKEVEATKAAEAKAEKG